MDVQVNYLAVLLAALSTMVVGSIWYTPKVFGNTWMKLAGLNRKDLEKNGYMPIVITVVVSLISAYVLAHVSYLSNQFFQNSFLQDSLTTAFWLWLGFTAARIITHDSFEGRRKKLTLLTITHELITFLVMGVIIGLMGVK
jgi:hypothetical protein